MNAATPHESAHPAPQRSKLHWLQLSIALFGAPLAWLLQMSLSEPLAAQACYPAAVPLTLPVLASLPLLLKCISAACLLLALGGFWCAWRAWQATRSEADSPRADDAADTGHGRTRFLALLATLCSGLFVTAILFTALGLLLSQSCASVGA